VSARTPDPDVGLATTQPIPAATVVLIRPGPTGPEVLLTRRPATMAFGPDIHVFPGGRVDDVDRSPAGLDGAGLSAREAGERLGIGRAPDHGLTEASALAYHVAAVRETAEETGIQVQPRDLIALSRWITPKSMSRRFDVRFFATFVPPGTEIVGGSVEVVDATWLAPRAALNAAHSGSIELWLPTYVTLQQLDGLANRADVRAAFAPGSAAGGPAFEPGLPGTTRIEVPWAGGIPGRRSTGWLVGHREIVVVDPADPTGITSDAVLAHLAASGGRLVGVVVSDLEPEHHAGVEMFAHGLGLPVVAPASVVGQAPYDVLGLEPDAPIPFGDIPLTLAVLATLPSRRTTAG